MFYWTITALLYLFHDIFTYIDITQLYIYSTDKHLTVSTCEQHWAAHVEAAAPRELVEAAEEGGDEALPPLVQLTRRPGWGRGKQYGSSLPSSPFAHYNPWKGNCRNQCFGSGWILVLLPIRIRTSKTWIRIRP